ncbi:hypothetical protein [Noviherbaspirillum malthae]|uniref:hypothetical protein n=1 Tax=Noviherbaspirillum malthae TaxID=1260987 RepID=UPI0018900269|nr:hypothetical protein [Noviherbaspirillum malthae]
MSRKTESLATVNVIKWAEEEWQLIASRLLEEKGRGLLESAQLEEVKAKDVFHAQNVLPESRHRKLISISQGFQAIRQRLHGILQTLEPVPQHELFSAPTSGVDNDALGSDDNAADPELPQTSKRSRKARSGPAVETSAATLPLESIASIEAEPSVIKEPIAADKPGIKGSAPVVKQPQQAALLKAPAPVYQAAQTKHVAQQHRQSSQLEPPHGARDLIELARPFVAMVCEEFASALFKAMAQKGSNSAMASLLRPGVPGTASSPYQAQQGHRCFATSSDDDAFNSRSASWPDASQALNDEDAHHSETDVQPLFDPKLPPSANSAFKPMIALVGTSTHDFEDLKQLFPQLELNIVALDDLRTAPSLRSCQRMVGLREDIPAPADEFLRKTFGNRYVRITGGIAQIREQLNTWLNNPGTMNAGASNGPRKQGNGKGQGGGYPKKRQFRRPRPNP